MIQLPEGSTKEGVMHDIERWIVGPKSARNRKVITDYLFGNYTYEELAELHDISVSTVQRIIDKGRDKIYR